MAGIGIKLNKFFEKNTITGHMAGIGYSIITTIAPMLFIIITLTLMQSILGYQEASYYDKQLFQDTILYIFIFSLLVTAPLNAVFSRYISDVIFEERYADIMPCYYFGLLCNLITACCMAVPFCIHAYMGGKISLPYICTAFACFVTFVLIFYTMLYLSICKDYSKISLFYGIGSIISIGLSLIFVYYIGMDVAVAMLLSITVGFLMTASLGFALLKQYFTTYSHCYRQIFRHIIKHRKLVVANTLYTTGLFVHNFVFWNSDLKMTVADTFICAETYDFASCVAMFTNISASVIFIALIEMHFNSRYKQYSEAIIGGRLLDIEKTSRRMFRLLTDQLMSLTRLQFIISTSLFLICLLVLQRFGYTGTVIQIYPCLAAGYFILFIMYPVFLFLYYFNDLNGALITSIIFFTGTLGASIISSRTEPLWYGAGLVFGAFCGWTYGYFRLRWLEKNISSHIFCNGTIIKQVTGKRPSGQVYPEQKRR